VTTRERTPTVTEPVAGRRAPGPDATDDAAWAINLFAAALALTVFTCLDAWLVHPTGWRLALLAAAVTVIAERAADPRTALGCAALAFAIGNGFLQNHTGNLVWNASIDVPYTLGLLGGAALGLSLGQARLAWHRYRRLHPFHALLSDATDPPDEALPAFEERGDDHALRSRQERTVTSHADLSVRP
jgi:hypothetical protein